MHSTQCLDEQPSAHRLDLLNHSALSDCCGAPIIRGGICFDCRELCEEDDRNSPSSQFRRAPITNDDRVAFTNIERPHLHFGEEASASAFDEMVLQIISH